MAEIFSLRPSEHDVVQQLLPWHVNGTLTPDESAQVEAHLAECRDCREDLAQERALAREVALLPLEVDEGWQAMALRMGTARSGNDNARAPFLRRSAATGWVIGGAIAASVTLTLGTLALRQPAAPDHTFHTLGSAPAATTGQVIVLFKPDTSEQQMRTILAAENARLVGGPTASGGYVLHIDGRSAADAIDALRQSRQVVLAEPITSDGRP
jgi:anti-sigma factor RsiW